MDAVKRYVKVYRERGSKGFYAAQPRHSSAPVEFHPGCDVAQGGVLLALPALLAEGLLRYAPEVYALPNGFYGFETLSLLLGLMALARIRSLEQPRYQAPGDGMEYRLGQGMDGAANRRGDLFLLRRPRTRVTRKPAALPRHYVARARLRLRATTGYWVNAMDGQAFLYVNKAVDPGPNATLKGDAIPWLEANTAKSILSR
jgi:hypothetical protein